MTGSDPLPTLPAQRLVLRELTAGDAADVLASFSNPEVLRFTNIDPLESLAEAKSWIAGVRAERDSRAVLHWGIARLLDDRILGTCKLFHLEPKHRRAEVGFALGREHWGKGYAAEGRPDLLLSANYACAACGIGFDAPSPQLFSFTCPQGMCKSCDGLGVRHDFDPESLVPDPSLSVWKGAVEPLGARGSHSCLP